MEVTRKCKFCKKLIDLQGEDYLVESKRFSHIMCWANNKYTIQKKVTYTLEECIEIASKKGVDVRPSVKEKIADEIAKKLLFEFISDTYGILNFPNTFYQKVSDVLTGKRRGLMVAIPPEDLLDMWKKTIPKLNQIHMRMVSKGRGIQGFDRIYYDIGVLVREYEDYLKWKQKQQKATSNIEDIVASITFTPTSNSKEKLDEKSDSLADILDELI